MNKALPRFGWPGLLLVVNILIVRKLFLIDYTAHLLSVEGTFIAISRVIAEHWRDLRWWPLWEGGLPFQFTYLPLLHFVTAGFIRLTGESPALAFHQVTAASFCIAPVTLYFMAAGITGRPHLSFLSALAFSLFSPCVWLVPILRRDNGGPWNLRRLQVLAYWGESPHIFMLAFLPLALLFLFLAVREDKWRYKVLAGLFAGLTVLSNAFGATILFFAAVSLLATVRTERFRRNAVTLAAIGLLAYAWISPLVPPSVLAAIRADAPTSGGDFRFNIRSFEGTVALAVGFVLLWLAARRVDAPLRFFLHFTFLLVGIVIAGGIANVYIVPQPHRYQIAMDMGLCFSAVFGAAAILRRSRTSARAWILAALLVACAIQFRHDIRYARGLIHSSAITQTGAWRVANWMNANMQGNRVMVSGSYSFYFNDFTNTPQVFGGHDQMLPNYVMRIANYVVYAGTEPVSRDAEISVLWLRALGANAISVPGPQSEEYYKPFTHPGKFEGVLPVLWREAGDTIYGLPARSRSLAHVVPAEALVDRQPIHGLDVGEIERYVKALDDPTLPEAPLTWTSWHSAHITLDRSASVTPGQAVSVQISYDPGWRAEINGKPLPIARDGLGFIALRPAGSGPCEINLTFGWSRESIATLIASLLVMTGLAIRMLFFRQKR